MLEKELDVVNFLRKQIKVRIILDQIFTRDEKAKMNHDKRLILESSISEKSENSGLRKEFSENKESQLLFVLKHSCSLRIKSRTCILIERERLKMVCCIKITAQVRFLF